MFRGQVFPSSHRKLGMCTLAPFMDINHSQWEGSEVENWLRVMFAESSSQLNHQRCMLVSTSFKTIFKISILVLEAYLIMIY